LTPLLAAAVVAAAAVVMKRGANLPLVATKRTMAVTTKED
jgi:hypothetical protein